MAGYKPTYIMVKGREEGGKDGNARRVREWEVGTTAQAHTGSSPDRFVAVS